MLSVWIEHALAWVITQGDGLGGYRNWAENGVGKCHSGSDQLSCSKDLFSRVSIIYAKILQKSLDMAFVLFLTNLIPR